MEQVIGYRSYQEYKQELDTELKKTAEGFVRIGYLLKVARDTSILAESQYDNVVDFARAEYGLDKTQVSRFMNINDKFSEGGYAPELKAEYQGFGYAKLSIMLLLPEDVNNVLTPDYSKAEIQQIKDEVDEEKKRQISRSCWKKRTVCSSHLTQTLKKLCISSERMHRKSTRDCGNPQ